MAQKPTYPSSLSSHNVNPEKAADSARLSRAPSIPNAPAQINQYSQVPSSGEKLPAKTNRPNLQSQKPIFTPSQNKSPQNSLSEKEQNNQFSSKPQDITLIKPKAIKSIQEQMFNYFDSKRKQIHNFSHYACIPQKVDSHITGQISSGELKVSRQRRQLTVSKAEYKRRLVSAKKRMVESQKNDIIRKLKTLQQQELSLVHQTIAQHRNKSVDIIKSQFTKEDKQAIASILKRSQSYEQLLKQRTQEYIDNAINFKLQQQEQLKKLHEQENQVKKHQIQKRLNQMHLKAEQRRQKLEASILKADRKYIHKELQKKYKSVQKQQERQIQEKLKSISQKHKLNIDLINQHDKMYVQGLQKRSKSLTLLPINHSTSRMKHNSYFSKLIEQKLFEDKQRNYERLMKLKQHEYKKKIQKYQQKIDKEHRPKVDPAKSIVVLPTSVVDISLTKEERMEKGLEYLAIAKELKKNQQDIPQPPKENQNYGYKAYQDYLTHKQDTNIDASKKQLREILSKQEEERDYESILRAKFLAEGISAKSKKVGDSKVYYQMKSKLSLLSQLY